MKNKKAQIATALLVIIAIGLSAAALFTLVTFNSDFVFQSAEMERITTHLNFQENFQIKKVELFSKYLIENCPDCTKESALEKAKSFDAAHQRTDLDGILFAKLRNGDFTFEKQEDETFKLEIKDLTIQSSSSYTKLSRTFDICKTLSFSTEKIDDCSNQDLEDSQENPQQDSQQTSQEDSQNSKENSLPSPN